MPFVQASYETRLSAESFPGCCCWTVRFSAISIDTSSGDMLAGLVCPDVRAQDPLKYSKTYLRTQVDIADLESDAIMMPPMAWNNLSRNLSP